MQNEWMDEKNEWSKIKMTNKQHHIINYRQK